MKRLVVTGAGGGIGSAIVRAAVAAGYEVGALDNDPGALESLADAGIVPLVADVTDEAALERAFDRFGPIDVLVNNAGVVRFGPLAELPAADWRAVVEVNLTGAFLAARTAVREMLIRGSGVIINITSMNGVVPGAHAGGYGATKAALALLTQQMALEWGPGGVRVNAVAPGLINAGMSDAIYADPHARAMREARVPLGRLGKAADVAAAVLHLASDGASYITGQELLVDGGVTMSVISSLPRPRSVDHPPR